MSHRPVADEPGRIEQAGAPRLHPSFGWASLLRRRRLLAIGALTGLRAALLYLGWQGRSYTASSQLLIYIRQILTGPDQAVLPGRADLPMVQNQIEILRSGNVLARLIETLHLVDDPEFAASRPPAETAGDPDAAGRAFRATLAAVRGRLSVRQIGTSHMVAVSFRASDPDKAARIVNGLVRIYLERGRSFDAGLSRAPALREIYQSLGPSAQVVSEAEPPVRPDGPAPGWILLGGALVGLGGAAAFALLRDLADDTIRDPLQIEQVLGLECLGVLPRLPAAAAGGEDAVAQSLSAGRHPALHRAMAAWQDLSARGPCALGVTSIVPGEGATTLALALAMAAAGAGKRVLLVDACSASPTLSRRVASLSRLPPGMENGGPGDPGTAVAMRPGLHLLPLAERLAGAMLMRPGLLERVVEDARPSYDLVVVDLPPLAAGPQAAAAADALDGFLLAARWGRTDSELVRQAFRAAGPARTKFVGAVLTMADVRGLKRYGYEPSAETSLVTAS